MTRLFDNNNVLEIEMRVWNSEHSSYSPDWSNDFFVTGCLRYDEEKDGYSVDNVDYCVDQAMEWEKENEDNFISYEFHSMKLFNLMMEEEPFDVAKSD